MRPSIKAASLATSVKATLDDFYGGAKNMAMRGVSSREAAEILGVSPFTTRRLVNTGHIRSVKYRCESADFRFGNFTTRSQDTGVGRGRKGCTEANRDTEANREEKRHGC